MKTNTIGAIALVIAILSLAFNGWLLYDRSKVQDDQKASALQASFASLMDLYCTAGGTTSETDMVALARQLPGAEEVKVETEDGIKKLVVGYTLGSGWADAREALNCSQQ